MSAESNCRNNDSALSCAIQRDLRELSAGRQIESAVHRGSELLAESDCRPRSDSVTSCTCPCRPGSSYSSHCCSRSLSCFSLERSTVLALSMTCSSTRIGARVRSASAIASLGRASIATGPAARLQMDQRVEGVLLQIADDDLLDRRLQVLDDVAQQVVRHRPRRLDVLDLQRDGVGLEHADPDRQHLLPVLIAQDDDRHVGDGIDHQPLDGHLDHHVAPFRLTQSSRDASGSLAPDAVRARAAHRIVTSDAPPQPVRRSREIHHRVAARPARQLPVAPPAGRVDQHLDARRRPTAGAGRLDRRCSACSATIRRVFSSSGTSSGIRFDASVFGRSEYLNENMLWNRTASVSDSVSSNSASVSPGKPTIISVDSWTFGIAARMRATRSRYSSRVCRRRIACSTRVDPDCTGRCRCLQTSGRSRTAAISRVGGVPRMRAGEADALDARTPR